MSVNNCLVKLQLILNYASLYSTLAFSVHVIAERVFDELDQVLRQPSGQHLRSHVHQLQTGKQHRRPIR